MPFNGSGTFTLPAGNPVVTQTVIDSTVYNTTQSGFATGLSNCITKDGQTTITANIPFSGFRLLNIGNPSAIGDAVNALTIQNFSLINLSSVSGTNTITASVSPTPSAYATGQMFIFEPANNNTGATTINISSLGAKDIYLNNAALSADVLVSGQPVLVRYNGTQFDILGNANATANLSPFNGFKNKIIGGDFTTNPWQRGTSFAAAADGSFNADRWNIGYTTSAVTTITKTADAPTAAQAGHYTQHCLHIDVTTADASIAVGDEYRLRYRVEGLNIASFGFGQSGTRYCTLSFWHKHTKTGTYCVGFLNAANNRSYVAEYTQDTTNTWEKATITFPVDTSGTWLYDANIGLQIFFTVASGTNFHTTANTWTAGLFFATTNQVNGLDSTSNDFKIALVQLEAGQNATQFEARSVGTELSLCQRYYNQDSGANYVLCESRTDRMTAQIPFPTEMRSAPTMTYTTVNATLLFETITSKGVSFNHSGGSSTTTRTITAYTATAEI